MSTIIGTLMELCGLLSKHLQSDNSDEKFKCETNNIKFIEKYTFWNPFRDQSFIPL